MNRFLSAAGLIGCVLALPAGAQDAGQPLLPIGLARIDITPDTPIRLGGYGNRRQESEGVAQKLWAKALAIGGGSDGPAVLITVDAIGIPATMSDEVARRLAKRAGVSRERLSVCATHTHTGPYINGVVPHIFGAPIPPPHQEIINRYTRRLTDSLETVALAALADRQPGRLDWAVGRAGFAVNRRLIAEGKWTGFGVNQDGPVDHAMPLLRITDANGKLRGVLVSYACHCTTFDGKFNQVHGDWAGMAQEWIEAKHPGVTALVAIGCGADANPRDRGDLAAARRSGQAIAGEVERLLAGPFRPIRQAPRCRYRVIELPLDRLPSKDQWQQMAKQKGRSSHVARAVLERLARGETLPTSVPYAVQTWAFGDDLGMVFLAGEVVVDYALRLRRELDPARLWICAYANDIPCYIPSKRLIAEGGYEVEQSMYSYDRLAKLLPEAEDLILRTVHELLPKEFAAAQPGANPPAAKDAPRSLPARRQP